MNESSLVADAAEHDDDLGGDNRQFWAEQLRCAEPTDRVQKIWAICFRRGFDFEKPML
ncbi:hypothetical protein Mal33_41320 [Rosistilla oblonga]|uniref:Uncharacterized protein n=1 Tax=Rosistilla oblonga TaxID=2527990 RepID=A0A518IYE8_9BACT|nr:hypothetical protein Mal33_41320 [Rosistilla oblonga]